MIGDIIGFSLVEIYQWKEDDHDSCHHVEQSTMIQSYCATHGKGYIIFER